MQVASPVRRVAAGLIDYAVVVGAIGLTDKTATLLFGEYDWLPTVRIAIWALALLAYLLSIRFVCSRGPGDRLLGIRRYRYSQLPGYEGKGSVACVEA